MVIKFRLYRYEIIFVCRESSSPSRLRFSQDFSRRKHWIFVENKEKMAAPACPWFLTIEKSLSSDTFSVSEWRIVIWKWIQSQWCHLEIKRTRQDILPREKQPLLSGKCHSIEKKKPQLTILTGTYQTSQMSCSTETVTSCDSCD